MTQNRSLLAHLARRLTDRTEDIAVEALGHILARSQTSRQALQELLSSCGLNVGMVTRAATQSTGEGGERPDLACYDELGAERVLIEAKFWAGLTENQPVSYLRRLPTVGDSALLVVAPAQRLDSLWVELRRRISEVEEIEIDESHSGSETRFAPVLGERSLVLTSWRNLLGSMSAVASSAGDIQRVNDIQQLQSLAEQEDANAFLPLRSEQLSPEFPRLLPHLYRLLDDAVRRLNQKGLSSTSGYTMSTTRYYSIRYMRFCDANNSSLGIYYGAWRTRPLTPIWLSLPISNLANSQVPDSLWQGDWRAHESGGHCYIPIYLRTGVEYQSVLDSMVEQLEHIASIVKQKDA